MYIGYITGPYLQNIILLLPHIEDTTTAPLLQRNPSGQVKKKKKKKTRLGPSVL
jgi:hypothetical protein